MTMEIARHLGPPWLVRIPRLSTFVEGLYRDKDSNTADIHLKSWMQMKTVRRLSIFRQAQLVLKSEMNIIAVEAEPSGLIIYNTWNPVQNFLY